MQDPYEPSVPPPLSAQTPTSREPYPPYPPPPTPQTSTNALVAVTMSAIGLTACPLIGSIIGLVLATSAKKEIDRSNGWITGAGLVTAARWLGWIGIAYGVAIALLFVAMFAASIGNMGASTSRPGYACERSEWFQQSTQEASVIITSESTVSNSNCWTDAGLAGGEFQMTYQSDLGELAFAELFSKSAKQQGWTTNDGFCFQKTIVGLPTYVASPNPDSTSDAFITDVTTDSAAGC